MLCLDGTIIAIPEVAFTKSPEQPVITSGMPRLQDDILGGKRTVMEYIMTPIQKSLALPSVKRGTEKTPPHGGGRLCILWSGGMAAQRVLPGKSCPENLRGHSIQNIQL